MEFHNEGAVADGAAIFVVGEEGYFFEARPEGVLFGGEGVEVVDVGFEGECAAVSRCQPLSMANITRCTNGSTVCRQKVRLASW
jgi:hypothetical protein